MQLVFSSEGGSKGRMWVWGWCLYGVDQSSCLNADQQIMVAFFPFCFTVPRRVFPRVGLDAKLNDDDEKDDEKGKTGRKSCVSL